MSESEDRTERTVVKTYVPEYQKEEWRSQADALDMTQSEFVRTMVQAGRRGFSVESEEPRSTPSNPGGGGLEDRVLELLSQDDHRSWAELVEDLEEHLEHTLDDLRDSGQVSHSPRSGGYALSEGDGGR